MSDEKLDVAIMMGSKSDLETMKPAAKILRGAGAGRRGAGAFGAPDARGGGGVREGRGRARRQGVHLPARAGRPTWPGAVAAHTTRPVIGVPIAAGSAGGLRLAAVDGADAARDAGGDGRGRRRRERGAAGGADHRASADAALAATGRGRTRLARRQKVLASDAEVRARTGRRRKG